MILTTPRERLPRLGLAVRAVLWAPIVFVAAIGGSVNVRHQAEVRRTQTKHAAERPARDAAAKAALERVRALWKSHNSPGRYLTLADLERELNGGRPLRLCPGGKPGEYAWTDPASGRGFELYVRRDRYSGPEPRWMGFGSGWGATNAPPVPVPRLLTEIEPARRAIAYAHGGWGPIAWGVLLVGFCSFRRWRAVTGELLLAAAVLTVTALFLNPSYTISLGGLARNDALVWAVPMLALSALLFGVAFAAQVPTPAGLCAACGYDIRATPDRCPECGTVVPRAA